jgi:hypothetical protein
MCRDMGASELVGAPNTKCAGLAESALDDKSAGSSSPRVGSRHGERQLADEGEESGGLHCCN